MPSTIIIAPPRSGGGLLAALLEQCTPLVAGPLSIGHPIDDAAGR